MPAKGTKQHVDYCQYQADVAHSAAQRNYWTRKAEESQALLELRG